MAISRRGLLLGAGAVGAVSTVGACAQRQSTTPSGVLNVGQISDSVAFFPIFIAEKKGYFTDEGLKLGERPRLGTGAKVAAALKSGAVDLGAGVITDAFNLAKIDDGTRIVSELANQYYVDIVISKSFDGIAEDAPLDEKAAALAGKRIGITGPGSGTEALVNYLFSRVGNDAASDATLVNLGNSPSAAIGALKSDRVDALAFFQPIGQQAEAIGLGKILVSPARGDVPVLANAMHGVVFSTTRLLDRKKHKEAAHFQQALTRAHQLIHDDRELARELIGEYLSKINDDALDALVKILRDEVPKSPQPRADTYQIAADFHIDSQLVEKVPEAKAVLLT